MRKLWPPQPWCRQRAASAALAVSARSKPGKGSACGAVLRSHGSPLTPGMLWPLGEHLSEDSADGAFKAVNDRPFSMFGPSLSCRKCSLIPFLGTKIPLCSLPSLYAERALVEAAPPPGARLCVEVWLYRLCWCFAPATAAGLAKNIFGHNSARKNIWLYRRVVFVFKVWVAVKSHPPLSVTCIIECSL